MNFQIGLRLKVSLLLLMHQSDYQVGYNYRKVTSSSIPRLVAHLGQQHPQKGQQFKQQHLIVGPGNSSTSRLVARLSQQHPKKGQKFKQQHVLVSSNKSNRSNLFPKSSTFPTKMQDPQEFRSDFSQSLGKQVSIFLCSNDKQVKKWQNGDIFISERACFCSYSEAIHYASI